MRLNKSSKFYWATQAKKLEWSKPPKKILIKNGNFQSWFFDGKINLYKNLIENKLVFYPKKKFLFTLSKDNILKSYSYEEVDTLVDNFIYYLKKSKKKKLKKIIIHSSATIESAVAMLACCKMNIFFSVIFEDLPLDAIKNRVKLFKPDIFISRQDKNFFHQLRIKNLKCLKFSKLSALKKTKSFKSKNLKSRDDFFCLFTSGSTGVPKGVVHSYGGYSVYARYTCKEQFGMNKNSIVLTASDAGWINGHTYSLFGPLLCGSSTILLESPLLLLDNKNLLKIMNVGTTILYLPVTLIRLLKAANVKINLKKNKIKTLGSMGEPLASSVGQWFSKKFNLEKKAIVNTYFQTETGGIISSPKHNQSNTKSPHGSVGSVITKYIKISNLEKKNKKEFIVKSPWPGCMSRLLNKNEWNNYWDQNKNFKMFDLATKKNNSIYIHGRIDDVINIRGHRIGSGELESVVLKYNNLVECCAISVDDKIEGNVFYLFVVSKKKINENLIEKSIENFFGSFAVPRKIFQIPEIPKTRSGKILRRLLRNMLEKRKTNKDLGDLSTILNSSIIPHIQKEINKYEKESYN